MMVLERDGANINHVSLSFAVMHKTLKSVDLCTQGGSKYECFIARSLQSLRKVTVFPPISQLLQINPVIPDTTTCQLECSHSSADGLNRHFS